MSDGAERETLVGEVRSWLAEHWQGRDDPEWRRRVVEAGWAAPTWPKDAFGRGLSGAEAKAIAAEFEAAGAPGAAVEQGLWAQLLGNTVLEHGSADIKRTVLPKLLTGEWTRGCLLYSEPGNGSDLAGLQTRAERDGEVYRVTGQKIWTTAGHEAQFALLLARTNWDVPKHAGISFFAIPMDLPGIEIRPIKQMTGDSHFNEVFLTDVPVPASTLIGEEGEGWRALQTALKEERRTMGFDSGGNAGPGDRAPIFSESDDLIKAAREAGKLDDRDVRQEIMRIHSWRLVNNWNAVRAGKEIQAKGGSSLASLGKLAKSRILHSSWALRHRLLGARAMVYDEAADAEAYEVDYQLLLSFINSIGGGTDQIQRNIISERILGLPKGYEPDKGVPFKDVRKGGTARADEK